MTTNENTFLPTDRTWSETPVPALKAGDRVHVGFMSARIESIDEVLVGRRLHLNDGRTLLIRKTVTLPVAKES